MTEIEIQEWLEKFIADISDNPELESDVKVILALRSAPTSITPERNARIIDRILTRKGLLKLEEDK